MEVKLTSVQQRQFVNKIKLHSTCENCGYEKEDSEHYFMQCPTYLNDRVTLFHATRHFHPLSVNTLLYGRDNLSDDENTSIFNNVQRRQKFREILIPHF